MHKYANGTPFTHVYDHFEYHAEDLDCPSCLHYTRGSKVNKYGCSEEACRFADIRQDTAENGRLLLFPVSYNWCRKHARVG